VTVYDRIGNSNSLTARPENSPPLLPFIQVQRDYPTPAERAIGWADVCFVLAAVAWLVAWAWWWAR
jgi:hypothetical protein